MTIEEAIKQALIKNGMFDNQADEVVERMKASDTNKAVAGRWGDDVDDYPRQFLNVMLYSAKVAALEYIDERCPLAWFRPMFA